MNKFIYAAIIVVVLIIYNLYIILTMINGNWISTEDFSEKADTEIYIVIGGVFRKDCKFLFVNGEAISEDITMTFITLPHRWLFVRKISGYIFTESKIFPKKIYFDFDPFNSTLKLYDTKVYGEFQKVSL